MQSSTPPFRAFLPLEETLFDDGFTCAETAGYYTGIADGTEDRLAAYRLVYEEYERKGFVPENVDGLWYTPHDFLPETTTFVVKRGDEVCSTVGVVADGVLGLPCEALFVDEVASFRKSGRRIAEVTSLSSVISSTRMGSMALLSLIRLLKLTGIHHLKTTDCLITVNPRHVEFYRKKLLFEVLAGPRSFEKVNGAPAVLLHLDLQMAPVRYAQTFGAARDSAYVHFYEPNRRQNRLQKWLDLHRRPQNADGVAALFERGLHSRLLAERPGLASIFAAAYPALSAVLSGHLQRLHVAA